VSATPEDGKLSVEEENWCHNVLTATYTVHGVFLDYDCVINKYVLQKVN
jgi:hypothetical protein